MLAAFAAGLVHPIVLLLPVLASGDAGRLLADLRIGSLAVCTSVWCFLEAMSAPSERPQVPSAGPSWLTAAIGLSLLATFWLSVSTPVHVHTGIELGMIGIGAGLLLSGACLRVIAIRTLGPHFLDSVAVLPRQRIVTHGAYGVVRHPSESGTLCIAAGGSVVMCSVAGAATCLVLLLPLIIWRTRLEDRVLWEHYPTQFPGYAVRVPALLPLRFLSVPRSPV